jgi:hypothetical protein
MMVPLMHGLFVKLGDDRNARIIGDIFVGCLKEGFSLSKVMPTYALAMMERHMVQ